MMSGKNRQWQVFVLLMVLATWLGLLSAPVLAQVPEYLELPGIQSIEWSGECQVWHEMTPQYCQLWHQSGHIDSNGDGVISPCDFIQLQGEWFHIVWVGPVVNGQSTGDEESHIPNEPTPTNDPTCEIWHEIRGPQVCGEFHVIAWHDANGSGVLDECDFIEFADQPGIPWHINSINIAIQVEPGTPVQTPEYIELPGVNEVIWPGECQVWHEVAPTFCNLYHQSGHIDSDGDGVITPCDFIQLDGTWYHVEWVGPVVHGNDGGPDESDVPTVPSPSEDPTCEIWHEIRGPQVCSQFHVTAWHDANGNGMLDECDSVEFEDQPGIPWHIDAMNVAVQIVQQDPPPSGPGYLELPGIDSIDWTGDCQVWHEVAPTWCNLYHQDGHVDSNGDGRISPCDYIQLDGDWYHVIWVGPVLHGNDGGLDESQIPTLPTPSEDPTCEYWHEIRGPQVCSEFHVIAWHDANGNGMLDECDSVEFEDQPGVPWHINEMNVAIQVEPSAPPSDIPEYLEIPDMGSLQWPGECQIWHEVAPVWCNLYHQSGHIDSNGDGEITACDYIQLNGEWYHIEWVGPVVHGNDGGSDESDIPTLPTPNEDPTCEFWHEIRGPQVCSEFHVTAWQDANGNGLLDECDYVEFADQPGVPWHIDGMGLAIQLTPITTGMGEGEPAEAAGGRFTSIAPNPSNPSTVISFELTADNDVQLDIYDVRGRLVKTLATGELPAREYSYTWDGTDAGGQRVSSGTYFASLRIGSRTMLIRKLSVIK